ncbi:MAG: thiamine diphosphokinase [Elusimicrobiaceae bacterium]|nr:thiamine diphosphokinase [Elusimicrobiaceae bacterium]
MKAFHHALLIGNSPDVSPRLLKQLAQQADWVIAADGGADSARKAGLCPDVIIGDLDSASSSARRKFSKARWIFVDNQNNTDLQKALDFISKQAGKKCTLAGFTGGRVDFSLGNILALYPYANKMELCLAGNGWKMFPLAASRRFTARPGTRVSLVPLKRCTGVTLDGLKFPLQNAQITLGTTRTLSNQAVKTHFSVSLKSGFLLVYIED